MSDDARSAILARRARFVAAALAAATGACDGGNGSRVVQAPTASAPQAGPPDAAASTPARPTTEDKSIQTEPPPDAAVTPKLKERPGPSVCLRY